MTRVQSKVGELFLTITGKGHPTDSSEKRSLSSSPYEYHVASASESDYSVRIFGQCCIR